MTLHVKQVFLLCRSGEQIHLAYICEERLFWCIWLGFVVFSSKLQRGYTFKKFSIHFEKDEVEKGGRGKEWKERGEGVEKRAKGRRRKEECGNKMRSMEKANEKTESLNWNMQWHYNIAQSMSKDMHFQAIGSTLTFVTVQVWILEVWMQKSV